MKVDLKKLLEEQEARICHPQGVDRLLLQEDASPSELRRRNDALPV